MSFHMFSEVTFISWSEITFRTFESFSIGMHSPMFLQQWVLRSSKRTLRTFIRLLAGVTPLMDYHFRLASCWVRTVWTLKWSHGFFTSVCPHVNFHGGFMSWPKRTLSTLEGFFASVYPIMSHEVRLLSSNIRTEWTFENFPCVYPEVSVEVRFVSGSEGTLRTFEGFATAVTSLMSNEFWFHVRGKRTNWTLKFLGS